MPAQLTSFFRRLLNTIREFTIAQRTIALIGVAVLVVGIAGLSMWAAKPSYTPLFSGLAAADANTIVEQLRTDSVPYKLTNGGDTILVPEQNVYDERLKAAAAGMPSAETGGYSLLDKMGVTSSEFQQSVTYKRAMEGELAHTIEALKGVKTASVRLAIPEQTVFVSEKADPTASVFVETENGITLTSDQVQAVVHLTSASIEGMKPSDVAVIDAAGTVLSAIGVGATGNADQEASDYEQGVKSAVQTMLDRVLGPGNATVAVAADMSYESAKRVDESFTVPDGAPALNESIKTEGYNGTGGGAAGVLGPDKTTDSTDAGAAADGAGTDGGKGKFNSEATTKNNALNKVTETRDIPAGAIKRQTISVAVDAAAAGSVNTNNLKSLISSAAGVDAARGDAVTVEVLPFSTASADAAAAALQAAKQADADAQRAALMRNIITALVVIVALILAVLLYLRRSRRQNREPMDIGELDELQDAPGAGKHALAAARTPVALEATPAPGIAKYPITPAALSSAGLDPNPSTTALAFIPPAGPAAPEPGSGAALAARKRAEIDALAEHDPERTAEYLRNFMDERQPV